MMHSETNRLAEISVDLYPEIAAYLLGLVVRDLENPNSPWTRPQRVDLLALIWYVHYALPEHLRPPLTEISA